MDAQESFKYGYNKYDTQNDRGDILETKSYIF